MASTEIFGESHMHLRIHTGKVCRLPHVRVRCMQQNQPGGRESLVLQNRSKVERIRQQQIQVSVTESEKDTKRASWWEEILFQKNLQTSWRTETKQPPCVWGHPYPVCNWTGIPLEVASSSALVNSRSMTALFCKRTAFFLAATIFKDLERRSSQKSQRKTSTLFSFQKKMSTDCSLCRHSHG